MPTTAEVYPTSTDPKDQVNDPRDLNALPALGEGVDPDNWATVNAFIDALAIKAVNFYSDPCAQADRNLVVYETGKSTAIADRDVISNKIAKDIRSMLSDLLREPVTRTITPEETNEPPQMVPLSQPMQAGVDPMTGQPMLQMAYPIDDTTQAKFEQKLVDYFWDKADLDSDIETATLNCRIAGWYTMVFEEDRQAMLPRLRTNISVRQVLLDPAVGPVKAVENANYALLRWRVNWWQARAMFPQLAKHLDAKASTSTGNNDPVVPLGVNEQNQTTGEKMVDLLFFWLRNYPIRPMTPEEAVDYGEVEQREVANDPQFSGGVGAIGDGPDNRPVAGDASEMGSLDGSSSVDPPTADGHALGVAVAGGITDAPPPRIGFFAPGSTEEITPASPEWPQWLGIRQITRVERCIAADQVCPFWDIPLAHMVANPVPLTACGQGDPETMQKMQEGRNRALTSAVEHADLMAHPVLVFSQAAWEVLPAKYKEEGASIAGMHVIVGNDLYEKLGGKISITNDAPPMQAALGQILEILGVELESQSPAPAVTQGRQTGDISGWQTTQMLQQQAASRLDLPAKFIEKMVRRVMNLVRHWALWRVPIYRIEQICTEYPPEVIEALVLRGRDSDRNINVQCNISSGGMQARKAGEAVQKFNLEDPATGERVIGMQTLRERMGEDNAEEQAKQGPVLQALAAAKEASAQADRDAKGAKGGKGGKGGKGNPGGEGENGQSASENGEVGSMNGNGRF